MKRIKQITAALLCCLFIPCAIASDTNMNLQPGLFKKLLAQSPSESLQELESLGIVNLLYAHDPELNAARREYYASLGIEPPLYYEGEGELVKVIDGSVLHVKTYE